MSWSVLWWLTEFVLYQGKHFKHEFNKKGFQMMHVHFFRLEDNIYACGTMHESRQEENVLSVLLSQQIHLCLWSLTKRTWRIFKCRVSRGNDSSQVSHLCVPKIYNKCSWWLTSLPERFPVAKPYWYESADALSHILVSNDGVNIVSPSF